MADEDAYRNSKDSGASGGLNRNNDKKPKSPVDDSKTVHRTSGGSDKSTPNVYGHVVDRPIGRNPNTHRFSKDSGGSDRSRDKKPIPISPRENPRSPRKSPEAKQPTHLAYGGRRDLSKPLSPKNDVRGRIRKSNESDRIAGSVDSANRGLEGIDNEIRRSNGSEQVVVEVDNSPAVVRPGYVEKSKTASNNWGNAQTTSDKTHTLPKPDVGIGAKVVHHNRWSKDSENDKNKMKDKRTSDEKKGQVNWGNVNREGQPNTDVIAPAGDGATRIPEGKGMLDVLQFLPRDAIKTVKLKSKTRQRVQDDKPNDDAPKPHPIASKVVYLKKPEPPTEEEIPEYSGPTSTLPEQPKPIEPELLENVDTMLKENNDDDEIGKRLNELIATYRGDKLRRLKKAAKARAPNYKFGDMIKTLNKLGIPCPTNEDFARLHGLHSRWDPDGNIIEYFSPMLRTFIPVNMRGRYRGCWPTDDCMKGLNISNIPPKRDALEGFVERGRHDNIQQKYDDMSKVAEDVAHHDFLVELQAYQAETLPIPIFYDMLHMGLEVANETLRILVQEEGYPPNNYIFSSALTHAEQIRRKIQLYAALGLESLESKRKGLGAYLPQWLKSRDEIVRDSMKAKDGKRYQNLEKMEKEGMEREKMRRLARKSVQSPRVSNVPNIMRKMSGKFNKVEPEKGAARKKSFA